MRLLRLGDNGELTLHKDLIHGIPPYAILSHTWGNDEVTFDDIEKRQGVDKAGHAKIQFCGDQARKDGIRYFWVDTCCIDKANHTELSEAITSMFRWYQDAVKCYVYLSDVTASTIDSGHTLHWWESDFRRSRWFTRGWTLQELLAPASVEFFSKEKQLLGNKKTLQNLIHEITQIPRIALDGAPVSHFSVDERLQWAANRHTKRSEDQAYCLLGIFGIYMPLMYGEGENAFKRLKEKIGRHLRNKSSFYDNSTLALDTGLLLGAEYAKVLSPSCCIPFRRDEGFVDDGNLLRQVEEKCAQEASRVALVGIGGIGKSQLAIEYCHRLHKRSPDTWIFWIHASNAERIEQGYREIAEQIQIAGRKDLQNNIFESVARWLQDDKANKWLLVLDNIEDDVMLSIPQESASMAGLCGKAGQLKRPLSGYLPHSVNGTLLVTTRTRSVATKLVKPRDVIAVDPMTKLHATRLLQKQLNVADSHSDLEELARVLEYMPLALVQAASYIRQKGNRYSVQQYIEDFRRSENRKNILLNFEGGRLRRDPEAKNSIITTWQISFNYIREHWPSSADLLALMSFFDRHGIPKEVLTVRTWENGWDDTEGSEDQDKEQDAQEDSASGGTCDDRLDRFNRDIDRLRDYSFVSIGLDEQTFEMHGLVQLAIRKWLATQGEDERWKGEFCRKLSAVFPTGEYKNWSQCARLFPHAKAAERQRPNDEVHLREWGRMLRNAGCYARAKGNFIEAERMCSKSAQQLRRLFGNDDVDTLSSMGNLASTYRYQGRWVEAEKIEVEVIETRRRVLGEEHPSTLTSMNNLASTYSNQGRLIEAEKLFMEVMEISRRVLGEEHPFTLTSINNLASTYRDQGRWVEAEEIEVEVIDTYRRVLGEEHPDTLTSMANLASTYSNQGRWTEAEKLEVEVMEARQQTLGEEHPSTLSSMANLASTYSNQGRWSKAEKMSTQVTETCQRLLGKENPSTLSGMANLASVYSCQGRWAEAEKIEVEVMETRRRVLGEEHPDTLSSMANLASTYWNQGRWIEAEKIEVEVIETRRRVLGEEHPDTLSSMANLASTYWNQGRWIEAEKMQVEVMETRRRVLGEEHPSTLSNMANLASTYRNQGRWTEAEKIEVEVVETRRRVLGEEHPSTLSSMANLALTYMDQGRWPEAEKIQVEVMETRRRVLGEEHPDTLRSMSNLASTYENQGRWTEAEKIEVEVVETMMRVLGEEHPDTLTSMNNLASTYKNQGRWIEAEKIQVEVMETRRRVLGEEHPDTLRSVNNLASTYWNQGRWIEAEKMQVEVMETNRRVLGEKHPYTLTSMANLAFTIKDQGRSDEAVKLMADCVQLRSRILGSEHPHTLRSAATLADWLSAE